MNPTHHLRRAAERLGLFVCRTSHPSLPYLRLPPDDSLAYALHRSFRNFGNLKLVQVGANDGLRCDPVRDHILRFKWSGLLVEPRAVFAQALRRLYSDYPAIHIAQAAVADCEGRRRVFFIDPETPGLPDWAHGLATLDRSRLEAACAELALRPDRILSEEILGLPWSSLPSPHPLAETDVLVIDAEGSDFDLLRLWDWDRARPRVVHFEHACGSAQDWLDLLQRLRPLGYEVATHGPDTTLFLPSSVENRAP